MSGLLAYSCTCSLLCLLFIGLKGRFDCSLSLSNCQRVCLDAEDVRARFATEIKGGAGLHSQTTLP